MRNSLGYGFSQYPPGRDNQPIGRGELANIINEVMQPLIGRCQDLFLENYTHHGLANW